MQHIVHHRKCSYPFPLILQLILLRSCPHSLGIKGACKYYLSTLGGVGGLKEMLILLMWFGGGSRGKMLILLMLRIKILIHMKMAFKSVNYHFTLWSKAIYEKISHIHPWITWYIRPGHWILCLGSLNLIQYITHIWTNRHSSII